MRKTLDVKKHIEEKERLDQALNGRLDKVVFSLKKVFEENNIDSMPELSSDVCSYAIKEIWLSKFNLPKC